MEAKWIGPTPEMMKGWGRNASARSLRSMEDVSAWAEQNGGEIGVRMALANNVFSYSRALPEKWLEIEERKRVMALDQATLAADQRAASAAEMAARWSMWSAIVSAAVGVFSAAAYWISRVSL